MATKPTLASRDRSCVWHPFTQMRTAPPPLPIVGGEGAYLVTEDGRRLLDGISSWWTNIHGHCHPHISQAVADQARRLEHVMFAGCTHPPAVELSERLLARLPPGLTRVFFSDNGSTAVEVALKMAYQFWANQGEPQRRTFLALEHAYHGDTVGAMSTSHDSLFTAPFKPLLFRVDRLPVPPDYLSSLDPSRDGSATEPLTQFERLLARRASEIAAVIIEPMVQGAGGMLVWKAEMLRKLREMCDRHGLLLIADEVMTGFGRTGKMFACEHGPVEPDLMCLSKGLTGGYLPLAVTVTSDRIYRAFLGEGHGRTFFHGHSFTANPLGCAAALAGLDLFDTQDVLLRVRQIEARLRDRLSRLVGRTFTRDARQIGGLAILEVETEGAGYLSDLGPRMGRLFLDRGLLLRPYGNTVYFMPPYAVTDSEIDRAFDQIEEVVTHVVRQG